MVDDVKPLSDLQFSSLLSVPSVLQFGYACHASRDSELRGTPTQRLAERSMSELNSYRCPPGTPDYVYLTQVRNIVLMLGQGLSRRKQEWRSEMDAADKYRQTELARVSEARTYEFWSNIAFRTVTAAGIGFAVAQLILPQDSILIHGKPHEVTDETRFWFSILMSLVSAAGQKLYKQKTDDIRLIRIHRQYEIRRHEAQQRYNLGKLAEYQRAEHEAARLWCTYTGRKATRVTTYASLAAEDVRMAEMLQRRRKREEASVVNKVVEKLKAWRRQRAKLKKLKAVKSRAVAEPMDTAEDTLHDIAG